MVATAPAENALTLALGRFLLPRREEIGLARRLGEAADAAKALDWRMREPTTMPVERLPGDAPR